MMTTENVRSEGGGKVKQVTSSNILVGPSLPPFVEGQLRCFLHLSIGEIKWIKVKPPSQVQIGVKWWGQQSKDVILQPKDPGSQNNTRSKYEVKYPIRSGPKQFTAYLRDMGALNLDICVNDIQIGQAEIKDIGLLCHSRPIQGFYPVMSVTSGQAGKEIASIFISLAFHSVSGSFNMTSSTIPTTDMTTPSLKNTEGPQTFKSSKRPKKSEFATALKGSKKKAAKEVKISSAPPEKFEYSLQSLDNDVPRFLVGPGKTKVDGIDHRINRNDGITDGQKEVHSTSIEEEVGGKYAAFKNTRGAKDGNDPDLLLNLIERGKDLRNKMLLSSLDTVDTTETVSRKPKSKPEGNLIRDILEQINEEDSILPLTNDGDMANPQVEATVDRKLVDLVTSEEYHRVSRIMKKIEEDSDASLSEDLSDIEDPAREDSLLTDLFYNIKTDSSDESSVLMTEESENEESQKPAETTLSLQDPGNKRPKRFSSKEVKGRKARLSKNRKKLDENDQASRSDDGNDSMAYLQPNSNASQDEPTQLTKDHKEVSALGFLRNMEKLVPEGMDLDTITILARIQFARVIINKLDLRSDDAELGHCTFFVEYEFPLSSREPSKHHQPFNEVMRCASNKIHNNSVLFNHRSVFPVHFDGSTIAQWWEKHITFKLFSRLPSHQTPTLIGKQSLALRRLLLDKEFGFHDNLAIIRENTQVAEDDVTNPPDHVLGHLQVSVELGSDKGEIKQKRHGNHAQLAARDAGKPSLLKTDSAVEKGSQRNIPAAKTSNPIKVFPRASHEQHHFPSGPTDIKPQSGANTMLQSFLCIPEGRAINCGSGLSKPANAYLVCRMFWDAVASKSQVCWNTVDPEFQFTEQIPVMLSDQLLDRAKNNFMVVEIWNKSLSADDDVLIGIVKVSLHPFYLSFKDPSIVKTLLKSQYPVISVDGLVQVKDLFGDADRGQLQVLLALGTQVQIANLLKMKKISNGKQNERISGTREMVDADDSEARYDDQRNSGAQRNTIEHIFSVSIDSAKNLAPGQRKDLGDTDCFVQYQFPEQKQTNKDSTLAWHKTPSTLFVENPVFGCSKKHCITTPSDVPPQNFFLASFQHRTTSKPLAIPFEVWQRSYYPNIRDCLLYKAFVPMAKVYAMITMSREKDASQQSFKLPLILVNADMSPHDYEILNSKAMLHVGISYQQNSAQKLDLIESSSPCVCISISILRACGLKATLSTQNPTRSHAPSGLNTFVKVWLSFLGTESCRVSPVIARTFAPAFSFHVDFPVNVVQDLIEDVEYEENSTLAYYLESGFLEVQIFHKQVKNGFVPGRIGSCEDEVPELLLGACKVPLTALLSRNTGIKGWFPVKTSRKGYSKSKHKAALDELERMAGGLELAVKFGKETDRELVINMARGVGWSPLESLDTHEESFTDASRGNIVRLKALLSIEKIWIPAEIIEKTVDAPLGNIQIYSRYKFYDKAAFATKLMPLERSSSSDMVSADLKHKKAFAISASSALSWYLREELIELQFWLKISKDKGNLTCKARDKLIGSVHVDANAIAKSPSLKGSVSGLYPLFKAGADFLGKSCARISLKITENGEEINASSDEESLSTNYAHGNDSDLPVDSEDSSFTFEPGIQPKRQDRDGNAKANDNDDDLELQPKRNQNELTGVECHFIIEEALHLPLDSSLQGPRSSPSTYVSYQLTPFHSPVCTSIVLHSTKPIWGFNVKERLDPIKIPNQVVNFKLFKKTSKEDTSPNVSKDVLLGIATVDISLLKTGFRQIHGWYNIVDYSGQNMGQLKVGIIPEKPVATSPSTRYFRKELLADKIRSDKHWSSQFIGKLDFLDYDLGSKDKGQKSTERVRLMSDLSPSRQIKDVNESETTSFSCNTSMFRRLRNQMADLDSLTKELQNKLRTTGKDDNFVDEIAADHVIPYRSFKSCLFKDQKLSRTGEKPEACETAIGLEVRTKNIATDNDGGHPKDFVIEPPRTRTPEDAFANYSGLQPGGFQPDRDSIVLTEGIEENNTPGEGIIVRDEEYYSFTDRNVPNPEHSGNVFDSFDDVLNDLQTYRQNVRVGNSHGYAKTSGSSDDHSGSPANMFQREFSAPSIDDLSFLSEINTQVDDRPKVITSHEIEEDDGIGNGASSPGIEGCFPSNNLSFVEKDDNSDIALSAEHSVGRHLDLDRPKLTSMPAVSSSNSIEEIGNVKPENAFLDSSDDALQEKERREDDEFKNATTEHTEYAATKERSTFSQISEVLKQPQKIPNFFMPPETLAQSMQKYRLAGASSKERNSVVDSDEESHPAVKKGEITQKYEKRKQFYTTSEKKLSLDKPPPLQSSEINRIASIFSAKFS